MVNDIFADQTVEEPEIIEDALQNDVFGATPEKSVAPLMELSDNPNLYEKAVFISQSKIVPAIYRNDPSSCFLALELAQRIGASPFVVLQNMHFINGKPGFDSKFVISAINTCGKFSKIRYEWCGTEGQDDWGCRAWVTDLETGDKLMGTWVTIRMAKDEGWYSRKGSKWKTMPGQMLIYRAAAFLSRAYMPEVTTGFITMEEHQDIIDVTPGRPIPAEETAAERAWREQNG